MSKFIWWLIALAGVGLAGIIIYSAMVPGPVSRPPSPVVERPSPVAAAPAEPPIRFPVKRPPEEKPLPALDTSDATMSNALNELFSDKTLVDLFQVREFVRRVVATVDNIPRKKIAQRLMPIKPAAGKFAVTGKGDSLAIDANNVARHAPYMKLLAALDTEKTVALYIHFYPLFQQAYQELGYPKGHFNDRLIEAIDHLLATPDVKEPIKIVRPKVLYEYADPELEALSAGQKALIRTGSEEAVLIKTKLRDIRAELMRQARPPQKKN